MEQNTNDLSKFGFCELEETTTLLTAFCNDPSILGDGVKPEFNPNSGNVFLVDEDYNIAMMNGDDLELWHYCPICGHEGFLEDMAHNEDDEECQEYLKEIGAVVESDEIPISDVIAKNKSVGGNWFEPETAAFFNSTYPTAAVLCEDVAYFVSGERYGNDKPIRYTVRACDMDTGCVDTIGEFQQHSTYDLAYDALEEYIEV